MKLSLEKFALDKKEIYYDQHELRQERFRLNHFPLSDQVSELWVIFCLRLCKIHETEGKYTFLLFLEKTGQNIQEFTILLQEITKILQI